MDEQLLIDMKSGIYIIQEVSRSSDEEHTHEDEDVVDFPTNQNDTRRLDDRDAGSPIYLQKPEAFGRTPSPVPVEPEYSKVDPNRSVEIISGRCPCD